ncbi:MAG: hypothetical protein IKY66_05400 [Bacteroidales bacterium]|nr:hypothetical protein [Bacteroidales bacterium]
MYDTELIDGIKTRLGITGMYHDELLLAYADDVKAYLLSGGVSQTLIDNGEKSIGVIARGVADLWNYGAGDGKFSDVFYQRMTQLRFLDNPNEGGRVGGAGDVVAITNEEIDDYTECLDD